jgi:hypothetical protein
MRNSKFEVFLNMGHPQRELVSDRIGRTFESAGAAVPAFAGITDDGWCVTVRPDENIPRADVVAVSTQDAFIIDGGWHDNLL